MFGGDAVLGDPEAAWPSSVAVGGIWSICFAWCADSGSIRYAPLAGSLSGPRLIVPVCPVRAMRSVAKEEGVRWSSVVVRTRARSGSPIRLDFWLCRFVRYTSGRDRRGRKDGRGGVGAAQGRRPPERRPALSAAVARRAPARRFRAVLAAKPIPSRLWRSRPGLIGGKLPRLCYGASGGRLRAFSIGGR